MDFRTVVDRLRERPTREDIADALGASFYSVAQALLPETSSGRRAPPGGWKSKLAKLARKRAAELVKLAEQLEK
jgi:hypothetical protein